MWHLAPRRQQQKSYKLQSGATAHALQMLNYIEIWGIWRPGQRLEHLAPQIMHLCVVTHLPITIVKTVCELCHKSPSVSSDQMRVICFMTAKKTG